MDAQSLLTPDAIATEMGKPLAHVPAPAGSSGTKLRAPFRRAVPADLRGARHHARALLDERALRGRRHGPVHRAGARPRGRDPRDLPHREHGRAPTRLAAHPCHLRELRPHRHDASHSTGTAKRSSTTAGRTWWTGRLAAATTAASRRSAGAPSWSGTWTGRRAGAWSARPSRAAARTWPQPAARATARTRSAAASSIESRRSTCPTSSSTSAARR